MRVALPTGMRWLLLTLCFTLLQPGVARAGDPVAMPGELLVQWRGEDDRIPLIRIAGFEIVREQDLGQGLRRYVLDRADDGGIQAAMASLEGLREVRWSEPNFIRQTLAAPNDPYYAHQWNLTAINLPKAWQRTTGSAGVVVAVVDTGILAGHPDLAGRLLPGHDFITSPSSAGDGNGWDRDPKDMGTDAPTSSAHHGTHVAGVLAARTNNGIGVAGVDQKARILPVRALGIKDGNGTDGDVIAAIKWAAGIQVPGAPTNPNPARVINLSFGARAAGQSLTAAVKAAQARGAIVVAAVGNKNRDGGGVYPASAPGVITVGAVQRNLQRAPYSNWGKIVDIMAPGGNLSQTLPAPLKCQGKPCLAGVLGPIYDSKAKVFTYRFYEGTSQAAPMVAGVVSLMLAVNGGLSGAEVLTLLKQTANPVSKCQQGCGAGLVNAAAALEQAAKKGGSKLGTPGTGNGSGGTPGGSTGTVTSVGMGGCAMAKTPGVLHLWPLLLLFGCRLCRGRGQSPLEPWARR